VTHAYAREGLAADGYAVVRGVLAPARCDALCDLAAGAADGGAPGTRSLLAHAWCRALADEVRAHPAVGAAIPADHVAVQCTYFEKSADNNWLVPVHQDLAIPVAQEVEHAALRGWSRKEGGLFVQPPTAVLDRVVAVRVHLDPCAPADGPLSFVPGTHRDGRIAAAAAASLKRAGPVATPVLARGDVLLMRPLVLHASSKATGGGRRRVLHFVFAPPALPFGLRWPLVAPLSS